MEILSLLILLALAISILLTMFALGLSAGVEDALYLFRRPGQLCRALLSMYVIVPLFVVTVILIFNLPHALEIGLITLMVSPMSPLLPKKALKEGGTGSYTIGLLVSAGVISIVTVPLAVILLGSASGAYVDPLAILQTVAITILVPLAAGMLLHNRKPELAVRIGKTIARVAPVLLLAGAIPLLITVLPSVMMLLTDGAIIAIGATVIAGLGAGHLLGGPEPADRMVLALTTSSRHPGVAMAIAAANFSEQKPLIFAGILLYLIVSAIIFGLYQKWVAKATGTGN